MGLSPTKFLEQVTCTFHQLNLIISVRQSRTALFLPSLRSVTKDIQLVVYFSNVAVTLKVVFVYLL